MTDLVVMSLEAWDGVWRRNQHLLSRLLLADPTLRVLFVEPAADPVHDVRNRRRPRFGSGPRRRSEVSDRLWTMQPTKALPRRFDRRADERIAHAVRDAAARLDMVAPLLWVNDPAAADVMRLTGWPTLYDMTDDWATAARPEREHERIVAGERMLLTRASQVVACSAELVRRKGPQRTAGMPPVVLIPNAVDVAAYRRPTTRPADLPAGRVALYAGTLHSDRLDVALCAATAQALAGEATLVLVGPNALRPDETRTLYGAGVRVLGSKPHGDVPAYVMHADVLLVPHVVDGFTDSLDPIKLYEYQATGRPVVSTAVAGFREVDDPRIVVADAEGFPVRVLNIIGQSARRGPAPKTDRAVADWADRAIAMAQVIRAVQP